MRLVDKPFTFPSRCAALSYMGPSYDGKWVDTGSEIPASAKDSHVYLSAAAVGQAAGLLGWDTPGARAAKDERIMVLEGELADVRAQLAEADKFMAAVEVFESRDFRARKKPGRPRKDEAVA